MSTPVQSYSVTRLNCDIIQVLSSFEEMEDSMTPLTSTSTSTYQHFHASTSKAILVPPNLSSMLHQEHGKPAENRPQVSRTLLKMSF